MIARCKPAFLVPAFLAWALLIFLTGSAAATPDPCAASDAAAADAADLPNVSARLAPGRTLDILSIGSGAAPGGGGADRPGVPAGKPRSTSEQSFPARMSQALQDAVPGMEVRLTTRGGKGLTAAEMLDVLRAEFVSRRYQLVIWQTGTVEAVRNLPPGDFAATLSEGAAMAQEAQADLVLVDPQFSRFLQTNANLDPYAQAFQQVAAIPGVALFRRYDLMRAWVNEGQIDLERAPRGDRQRTVEALHRCLGLHLARLILSAGQS